MEPIFRSAGSRREETKILVLTLDNMIAIIANIISHVQKENTKIENRIRQNNHIKNRSKNG